MGQILAGALGGLGFSIVFGVRKKYMALIALNAGLSWAVYLAVNALAGDFAPCLWTRKTSRSSLLLCRTASTTRSSTTS